SFTGTLYGSASQALNQFKDSTAAKGTACGITAGGVPVPNCKYAQFTVTSGGQKLEKIYGAVPYSNGLAEVLAVVSYSDFQSRAKQSAILGDFFAVVRGGLSNL
ncbi:MAG TPA: hypothetical protein VG815_20315, partial [Chloroflexota bacterium]|nr:hypothetical protein [Chloroflexota bacterium]